MTDRDGHISLTMLRRVADTALRRMKVGAGLRLAKHRNGATLQLDVAELRRQIKLVRVSDYRLVKLDGAGPSDGQYTGQEYYPDGTDRNRLAWDGTSPPSGQKLGYLHELSGKTGLEPGSGVSDTVYLAFRAVDSNGNHHWVFSSGGDPLPSKTQEYQVLQLQDTDSDGTLEVVWDWVRAH